MTREITMPQLGFTMVEGTVAEWRKTEGEWVEKGEALLEVTTDKVSIDVESPVSGTVRQILVPSGSTVPVGTPICLVSEQAAETPPSKDAVNLAALPSGGVILNLARPGEERAGTRVRASGLAKRLARENAVDLAALPGSGPGGRVLEADVLGFLAVRKREMVTGEGKTAVMPGARPSGLRGLAGGGTAGETPALPASQPSVPPGRRVPYAGNRRIIGERMLQSVQSTAQVTLVCEVDATEMLRLRGQLLPEWEKSDGIRLTLTDLIVKACARVLREHPALNATLEGEEIVLREEVNVGIAVALPDGLIVPVLRDAGSKQLRVIAAESRDLVDRARAKRLSVDDVSGGTFTVTNLGSYGIDLFTPIINPSETAILGVGRVAERPAVYGGEICKRSLMYLSLTFDHRLVDGAPAAEFMQRLRELIERPYLLLA